jgi:hypothetical protein
MRLLLTLSTCAALFGLWSCRQDSPPARVNGRASEVLARYHFVGRSAVAKDEHGTQFKKVTILPESAALLEQTLERLAKSPAILFSNVLSADRLEQASTLIRPLLDDLVEQESFLEIHPPRDDSPEWLLGVALPAGRAALWHTHLERIVDLWELGPGGSPGDTPAASGPRHGGLPEHLRWSEIGGWFIIGAGAEPLPFFDEAVAAVRENGRPTAALSDAWFTLETDLGRIAPALGLSTRMIWPRAALRLSARGENLRTTMNLSFPEPVTGPIEAWHVPTNVACEPLVSFTAARGIAPILERSETLRALEFNPAPNELYLWAQEHVVFQTFCAFPTDNPTNRVERIAALAPKLLGESWQKQGLAQIEWQSANHQAIWKGLLMVTPHLRPARDAGTNFIVGGLFPQLRTTNPPPADLLAQFVSRPDVIYYDWEITQARLAQWRNMAQLFAVILREPQMSTNTAGLNWLVHAEPLLGNTITEITAVSPKEWSFVRRSHAGFTGLELVTLTRWLESREFPRLSLRLPEDPKTVRRPPSSAP